MPYQSSRQGAHGLKGAMMHEVTRATVVARLLYEAPEWWGFYEDGAWSRLQTTIWQGIWQTQSGV